MWSLGCLVLIVPTFQKFPIQKCFLGHSEQLWFFYPLLPPPPTPHPPTHTQTQRKWDNTRFGFIPIQSSVFKPPFSFEWTFLFSCFLQGDRPLLLWAPLSPDQLWRARSIANYEELSMDITFTNIKLKNNNAMYWCKDVHSCHNMWMWEKQPFLL